MSAFIVFLASAGVLMAVLVTAASARAVRGGRPWWALCPRPSERQWEALARSLACMSPIYLPFEPAVGLRLLSDEQLAEAWRGTTTELTNAVGPCALACLWEERSRYLDEFESRRPNLLRAWLVSDVEEPDSLLLDTGGSCPVPSTFNWDGLTGGQATDR